VTSPDGRLLLEEYVRAGMLMQVATTGRDGSPAVCQVWYHAEFDPDRLLFISHPGREHSASIRERPTVAGAVCAIPLTGLGQQVRGVTFKGDAFDLGAAVAAPAFEGFAARWPAAAGTASNLYSIRVSEWVLFDEQAYPGDPRQVIAAR
jgi:uncharacterized protein YhbP (UPF0306 family)